MRQPGRIGIIGALAVLPGILGACAARRAPPTLARIPEERAPPVGQLDEAERAQVLATMREAVETPGAVPSGAVVTGLRWPDDARAAARAAVGAPGIEMAVVRTEEPGPDELVFMLRGTRGEPGALRVRRAGDAATAEASIGRFPDDPADCARAALLVEAFDARLAEFAAKRKLVRPGA